MSRTSTSRPQARLLPRPICLSFFCLLATLCLTRLHADPLSATPPHERPDFGPTPDWVEPTTWTVPAKMQVNPSGQDFLVLDEQMRLASEDNYHHRVFQIVSDAGRQSGSQVYFTYDPSYQKLTIHHLRLVRGETVSDRLDASKIQVIQQERDLDRQLYNGERSALVILDDVRIGDIIDLAYTLHGRNPVFEGKFIDGALMEWGVPVRDLQYRLLVPAGRTIGTKLVGSATVTPRMRIIDGEQELTWHRTNLPIVESEERVPASHQVFTFLDLSEFASWADVVRWAEPLYAVPEQPDPLIADVIAEIRAKARSPDAQALAALDFVQNEIRYLGIQMGPGSHRPSAPAEVLRRRFGDCKDKSRLLVALLRGLGLDAAPALVHSTRREGLYDRLPTPYAFDHAIVALDLHGQRYLLDPTLSYQRGNHLSHRLLGRYGPYLRIGPDSVNRLQDAPAAPNDCTTSDILNDFTVTAFDQPAEFTITTTANGRAAEHLRAYFANRTREQISREYLNYLTPYYPGIAQAKMVEFADDELANRCTVRESYRIERIFTREADSKVLRAEFQPASMWDYIRMPNLAQRRFPFALSHPVNITERLIIRLPEDWKIHPQQDSVDDPAFRFTFASSNPEPRIVKLSYTWESKADAVALDCMAAFSANIDKARRSLGYQLTWDTGASPAALASFSPNWPLIGLALGLLLAGGYASWRIVRKRNPVPPVMPIPPIIGEAPKPVDPYSYKARVSKDPEGLGGWLALVGFGLIIRPLWLIHALYEGRAAYFDAIVWERLTSTGSELHNPYFSLVAPLEMMMYVFLLIFCGLLLALFFRQSYLFPRAIQIYFGCMIAASLFSIWDIAMLQPGTVGAEAYSTLFQAVIIAAVWIPYFQVSRRVKLTFVR